MQSRTKPSLILEPTEQQLIEIRQVNLQIRKLIRDVNRPYSLAASAVFIPVLCHILFLNRYSPFHSQYEQLKKNITKVVGEVDCILELV